MTTVSNPALLTFSPAIIWNYQHEWVSFLFQSSRRAGEIHSFRWDTVLQLISGQMGVLNPIIFCCFAFSLFYVVKKKLIFMNFF